MPAPNQIGIKRPFPLHEEGACCGMPSDLFFPRRCGEEDDGLNSNQRKEQAIEVCNRCPVREECLEWAIQENEPYGVYGGKSANERKAIRRRRGLAGRRKNEFGHS